MVYVTNRTHVYVGLISFKLFFCHWNTPKLKGWLRSLTSVTPRKTRKPASKFFTAGNLIRHFVSVNALNPLFS
jgi:hypothetical protein